MTLAKISASARHLPNKITKTGKASYAIPMTTFLRAVGKGGQKIIPRPLQPLASQLSHPKTSASYSASSAKRPGSSALSKWWVDRRLDGHMEEEQVFASQQAHLEHVRASVFGVCDPVLDATRTRVPH
eukprot:g17432.t1